MPFKYDASGNLVTTDKDGKKLPVFVHPDGAETAFDGDDTLGRIKQLNDENAARRHEAKEAGEKLKSFEGVDPEAAKKALQTVKDLADGELVKAGKVEEVRAAAVQAMEGRLKALETDLTTQLTAEKGLSEKLRGQLHSEIIGGSFSRSKFIGEKVAVPADMLQAQFGRNFKVEDGKLAAYDQSGARIHSRQRPGDPNVDFEEAIEILVDSYPYKAAILKGSNASGGGAGGSGGGGDGGGKKVTRAQFEQTAPHLRAGLLSGGATLVD